MRRPWAVWLMGLYIFALLALPADFGVQAGGVVLSPSRLVLLAAAAVAMIEWRSLLATLRTLPWFVWAGWLAFLAAALISAAIAPSVSSWGRYGSLVAEGLVVFVLVGNAASAPGGLRALIMVFAATLVAVASLVMLLSLAGIRYDHVLADIAGTVPVPDSAPRYGIERQPGPFRAPLYFAIWMTAASALLLPALAEGTRRARALALVAWVVLLVAVVSLTASRLAMTTMFLFPAAYFFARGPRLVGAACLVAALGIAFGLARLIPSTPVIEESATLRITAIDPALQAIRVHPLFGWGLLSDSSVLSAIIGKQNYVDDTYLSLAVEVGLVGLGAFVLLALSIVSATRRGWATPVGLAPSIAVAGVLAMGVFASIFQVTQGYAAFFVLAALAVVASVSAADRSADGAADRDRAVGAT